MKFFGHAIVLQLEPPPNLSIPTKIVLRNAIKEIPDSVCFRFELLRVCGLFPFDSVNGIDDGINDGNFNNLKNNNDAWILQAGCAIQARVSVVTRPLSTYKRALNKALGQSHQNCKSKQLNRQLG